MLTPRKFSYLTVIVFSLVLLAHLARILYRWNMNIGGWNVPMWVQDTKFKLKSALEAKK